MLKKGYKQTEIGVVPEDWVVIPLSEVGMPKMCKRVLKNQTSPSGEIPFYKIGTFGNKADAYISKELFNYLKSKYNYPNKGDILVSAAGTIGRTVVFDGQDSYFQDSNIVWVDNNEEKISNEFLFYYYKIIKWKTADGGVVSRLYNDLLLKTIVVKPLPEEQKAIATALSDVDNLIDNLEKLIEKKKKIKQGTMQELLTGKKRLFSNSKEWSYQTLESLCYLITKQTGFDYSAEIKPSLINKPLPGYIPFIQNKDFEGYKINFNTDFYIPRTIADKYPKIKLDEKCLLISISGRIGNVGIFNNQLPAFIGGAVGIAKFNDKNHIEWCMMYLQSTEGQKQIFANEKAGAQHNLTIEDIRKLAIPLPSQEEQATIIHILSNMNLEIEQLEKKLNKTKLIKQGMMQKLLTGEIRLLK